MPVLESFCFKDLFMCLEIKREGEIFYLLAHFPIDNSAREWTRPKLRTGNFFPVSPVGRETGPKMLGHLVLVFPGH